MIAARRRGQHVTSIICTPLSCAPRKFLATIFSIAAFSEGASTARQFEEHLNRCRSVPMSGRLRRQRRAAALDTIRFRSGGTEPERDYTLTRTIRTSSQALPNRYTNSVLSFLVLFESPINTFRARNPDFRILRRCRRRLIRLQMSINRTYFILRAESGFSKNVFCLVYSFVAESSTLF